ncbi:MAG: methylenetetrahydrofolate--tRNA-(uracil(54)-C(5))-methyltransferase (FADH(2)-oxidizing) TrmFO [Clostridia bacterium]|nr:methylenetetrahydrofolate--tRNA-(uracil(54)-C(5))-methyltransferase (FADH(2)-oxidizing) TrmFO [Clostridia bacterium]
MQNKVKIIGAGLAGSEAAIYLADRGINVELYDVKPKKFTPAHKSEGFAELVCSNSLKSGDVYGNASGLMKEEMRLVGSAIIDAADKTKVRAGNALAVDRDKFSEVITERIKAHPNIKFICEEVNSFDDDEITVIATGPLTTDPLAQSISKLVGDGLHFYDASAPIVTAESIDMEYAFFGDRYGKGDNDHLNLPFGKEEYELFISELINAKKAELKSFEKSEIFEGCMPVEVMAARGKDTLRFGPLKPVGLTDPKTGRWPYACLQLRKENEEGSAYNLVGFQTNLLFPEQKRVFGIIPALKNAEYLRYGVMHRNTFVNAPNCLNCDFSVKGKENLYFAGQITGVEGYVESAVSGLVAAVFIYNRLRGKKIPPIPETTTTGALIKYITTPNKDFQPMNANFGILPPLGRIIKDKSERKRAMAERSLKDTENYVKEYLQ